MKGHAFPRARRVTARTGRLALLVLLLFASAAVPAMGGSSLDPRAKCAEPPCFLFVSADAERADRRTRDVAAPELPGGRHAPTLVGVAIVAPDPCSVQSCDSLPSASALPAYGEAASALALLAAANAGLPDAAGVVDVTIDPTLPSLRPEEALRVPDEAALLLGTSAARPTAFDRPGEKAPSDAGDDALADEAADAPASGIAAEVPMLATATGPAGGDRSVLPTEPERAGLPPMRAEAATAVVPAFTHRADLVATTLAAGAALTLLFRIAGALYHRLQPSEALDHPARRAILDALKAGHTRLADIARATGLHPKTARYHAESLIASRLILRDSVGFRLPGQPARVPLEAQILEVVRAEPGIHVSEIARRLDVSKAAAQVRVTDLLLAGALESEARDGARHLYVHA